MIVSLKTDIYLFRSVSVSDETPLGKITIQFRQEEVDKKLLTQALQKLSGGGSRSEKKIYYIHSSLTC